MYTIKTLLAAAAMTAAMTAGATTASAAPWDRQEHRPIVRHDQRHDLRQDLRFERAHRPILLRERVFDSLRRHHYRGVSAPVFVHGHYVVKSFNRFGHIVFVEVDAYTGAVLGEVRI